MNKYLEKKVINQDWPKKFKPNSEYPFKHMELVISRGSLLKKTTAPDSFEDKF